MAEQQPIYSWEHLSPFKLSPLQSPEEYEKLTACSANTSKWPGTTMLFRNQFYQLPWKKEYEHLEQLFIVIPVFHPPAIFNGE